MNEWKDSERDEVFYNVKIDFEIHSYWKGCWPFVGNLGEARANLRDKKLSDLLSLINYYLLCTK